MITPHYLTKSGLIELLFGRKFKEALADIRELGRLSGMMPIKQSAAARLFGGMLEEASRLTFEHRYGRAVDQCEKG
jgi:predicted phage-related endonuclease